MSPETPRHNQEMLASTSAAAHPACLMCSSSNPQGLHLAFKVCGDGGVEATFCADDVLIGYPNLLHGGIVASLLDAAMTNCLFAHGHVAVTAELNVRYRHPVLIQCPIRVHGRLDRTFHSLYYLRAELLQEGVVKAFASAKFMSTALGGGRMPVAHGHS